MFQLSKASKNSEGCVQNTHTSPPHVTFMSGYIRAMHLDRILGGMNTNGAGMELRAVLGVHDAGWCNVIYSTVLY